MQKQITNTNQQLTASKQQISDALFAKHIEQIHSKYYETVNFKEIEHIPSQFAKQLAQINQKQESLFELAAGQCLIINYRCFDLYYLGLLKILNQSKNHSPQLINKVSEILLSLNGENQKAWNCKKAILNGKFGQKNEIINKQQLYAVYIQRELRFNSTVCMKFKKSTCYFQYRQQLIKRQLFFYPRTIVNCKQFIKHILNRQSELLEIILTRFFRNYYCWLYRIKYMNLILVFLEDQSSSFEEIHNNQQFINQILAEQLKLILKFLDKNINDYSAYSYVTNFLARKKQLLTKHKQFIKDWAHQNLKFCELAYETDQSYKNLRSFDLFIRQI